MPQSMGSQRDGHDSVNEQQMDKQKDKGNDSCTYSHVCDRTDCTSEKRQYNLTNKWI